MNMQDSIGRQALVLGLRPAFSELFFLGGAHVSYLQQQNFDDRQNEQEEVEAIGGHGSD